MEIARYNAVKENGMIRYTWEQLKVDCRELAQMLRNETKGHVRTKWTHIYGVPRGGISVALMLANEFGLPMVEGHDEDEERYDWQKVLVVDDVIDSGATRAKYPGCTFACLHVKKNAPSQNVHAVHHNVTDWIVYPWEGSAEGSIEDAIIRQLQYIGEDPTREGLLETPARVTRSWDTLYGGYKQDPEDVMKVFKEETYNQIVLLKDIEFYSTCEHHMLPFFGRAHIAYIPDKKLVGISKLARLLEIVSRRLQIQERIGEMVTKTLMETLAPQGAACILEAQHFCMTARGVQKQHSKMVTSSLTGVFLEKQTARTELMELIKK